MDLGYMLNITANITDQAIEFEERCMGEALRRWHITKEDVLERVRKADRLQAENEKLRAELEQVRLERDAAVERIREWEKFDTYLLIHNFITPEKWRSQKEN